MKYKVLFFALAVGLSACSNDDCFVNIPTNASTAVNNLSLYISTDKACYSPGETVKMSVKGNLPTGARIRYRHGKDIVTEESLSNTSWTWIAPQTDFTGYLVDIYQTDQTGKENIYGTIAIDVSSDWSRFPRYGFVADFDYSKSPSVIADEMAFLNRCHINGVQFYDWHNKHHWPLGGTRDNLLSVYPDIANRDVVTQVVKDYISSQHTYGMKAMFYNLCFGALDDALEDGVDEKWHLYTNRTHTNMDKHPLNGWGKSDIYLIDPSNTGWQQYLAQRNDDVYANFDFDGYHVDQLGDRGDVYDYYGSKVNLKEGYHEFLKAMKAAHPDKSLVMNAVSNYGANRIGKTGVVDFMYNELWGGESLFTDIYDAIKANSIYSDNKLKTVLAAYMNYDRNGEYFNEAGIRMTDAVIFALGGAHLELGDHMLCNEYFANKDLKMTESLKSAMICYYDFMTAYQNLLRGNGTETSFNISSDNNDITINTWPPRLGGITVYGKKVENKEVIHLINFRQANSLSWRDTDSSMPAPTVLQNLPLQINTTAKHIWVATPDHAGGVPQELTFTQNNGTVSFTLPYLEYWTMIVIEK